MEKKKYVVHVDESLCKGCWICVDFCPAKVLHAMDNGKVQADAQEKCIGCRVCENRCPDYALDVEVQA